MARRLLVWVALAILSQQGVRGSETTVGQVPDTQPSGVVRVGARVAFVMMAPVGSISAAERADIVNRRIETVLGSEQLDPQQIILENGI